MTPEQERVDKALDSLSHARTALDDPIGLPDHVLEGLEEADQSELDQFGSVQGPSNLIRYAIDKIDDAMRLLNPEKNDTFVLSVALDGAFVEMREFDAEDEAIEAIGEAISLKRKNPGSLVSVVLGQPVRLLNPEKPQDFEEAYTDVAALLIKAMDTAYEWGMTFEDVVDNVRRSWEPTDA